MGVSFCECSGLVYTFFLACLEGDEVMVYGCVLVFLVCLLSLTGALVDGILWLTGRIVSGAGEYFILEEDHDISGSMG